MIRTHTRDIKNRRAGTSQRWTSLARAPVHRMQSSRSLMKLKRARFERRIAMQPARRLDCPRSVLLRSDGCERGNHRRMFVRKCPISNQRGANYHTRLLVSVVSVPRRGERDRQRLLSERGSDGERCDQQSHKRCRERQYDAPPVLSGVRHASFQCSRSAAASHLRAGRLSRRSGARASGDDDLDLGRADLGLLRRPIAEGKPSAAAGGAGAPLN